MIDRERGPHDAIPRFESCDVHANVVWGVSIQNVIEPR